MLRDEQRRRKQIGEHYNETHDSGPKKTPDPRKEKMQREIERRASQRLQKLQELQKEGGQLNQQLKAASQQHSQQNLFEAPQPKQSSTAQLILALASLLNTVQQVTAHQEQISSGQEGAVARTKQATNQASLYPQAQFASKQPAQPKRRDASGSTATQEGSAVTIQIGQPAPNQFIYSIADILEAHGLSLTLPANSTLNIDIPSSTDITPVIDMSEVQEVNNVNFFINDQLVFGSNQPQEAHEFVNSRGIYFLANNDGSVIPSQDNYGPTIRYQGLNGQRFFAAGFEQGANITNTGVDLQSATNPNNRVFYNLGITPLSRTYAPQSQESQIVLASGAPYNQTLLLDNLADNSDIILVKSTDKNMQIQIDFDENAQLLNDQGVYYIQKSNGAKIFFEEGFSQTEVRGIFDLVTNQQNLSTTTFTSTTELPTTTKTTTEEPHEENGRDNSQEKEVLKTAGIVIGAITVFVVASLYAIKKYLRPQNQVDPQVGVQEIPLHPDQEVHFEQFEGFGDFIQQFSESGRASPDLSASSAEALEEEQQHETMV